MNNEVKYTVCKFLPDGVFQPTFHLKFKMNYRLTNFEV